MSTQIKSLVGVGCGTTGTSDLVLSSALDGFMTLADAGITNGQTVCYLVKNGNDRELGYGTYISSGVKISRDTVIASIESGVAGTSKLTLDGSSEVYLSIGPADLQNLIDFKTATALPTSDGTDGQVLQTDGAGTASWATPAFVSLGSVTASSSTNVDLELTGGFTKYRLLFRHFKPTTDNVALYLTISIDGGSSFIATSTYDTSYSFIPASTGSATSAAGVGIILGLGVGNVSDEGICGSFDLFLGNGTGKNRIVGTCGFGLHSGSLVGLTMSGEETSSTTAATDVRLAFSSGVITFGTVHLYGYN